MSIETCIKVFAQYHSLRLATLETVKGSPSEMLLRNTAVARIVSQTRLA